MHTTGLLAYQQLVQLNSVYFRCTRKVSSNSCDPNGMRNEISNTNYSCVREFRYGTPAIAAVVLHKRFHYFVWRTVNVPSSERKHYNNHKYEDILKKKTEKVPIFERKKNRGGNTTLMKKRKKYLRIKRGHDRVTSEERKKERKKEKKYLCAWIAIKQHRTNTKLKEKINIDEFTSR